MRPVVRASLAVAAVCALTAPLGSMPRTRVVPAAVVPPKATKVAPTGETADLSAVCPAGMLPDGEVCVPFDRAVLRAPLQNAEAAPLAVVRGGGSEQTPRREGRPASLDAYRLPVSTFAAPPRLGARGGVEVEVPAGAVVFALSLHGQEGVADVFAIEPLPVAVGQLAGQRVFTHHVVREGDARAEIILSVGPIAAVAAGVVVGARVADGDRLGLAGSGTTSLRIEARRLRDGLDLASLAGTHLLAEDRALRVDPRNVLPLR